MAIAIEAFSAQRSIVSNQGFKLTQFFGGIWGVSPKGPPYVYVCPMCKQWLSSPLYPTRSIGNQNVTNSLPLHP